MEQKISLDDLPYVLQFNKRDLPSAAPVHYLDFLLNQRAHRVPFVESVARDGTGVFETLNLIARMVLASFLKANNLPSVHVPECVAVSSER
jgi:mutual gliding-motility protein MglA